MDEGESERGNGERTSDDHDDAPKVDQNVKRVRAQVLRRLYELFVVSGRVLISTAIFQIETPQGKGRLECQS